MHIAGCPRRTLPLPGMLALALCQVPREWAHGPWG
jgi:hypothetical protein